MLTQNFLTVLHPNNYYTLSYGEISWYNNILSYRPSPLHLFTSDKGRLNQNWSKPWFLLGEKSALKVHSPFSSFSSRDRDSWGNRIPPSADTHNVPTAATHTKRTSHIFNTFCLSVAEMFWTLPLCVFHSASATFHMTRGPRDGRTTWRALLLYSSMRGYANVNGDAIFDGSYCHV